MAAPGYQSTPGYPPAAGYPAAPGAGYPSGPYAPAGGAYPPPQGGAYPPAQGGAYPPPQGGAYPPAQGGAYPPAQNGGYPLPPVSVDQGPPAGAYPPPQGSGYPPPQPTAPVGPTAQPIAAWQPQEGMKYQGTDIPSELLGEDHMGQEPTAPPLGPPPAFTGYEVNCFCYGLASRLSESMQAALGGMDLILGAGRGESNTKCLKK